MSIRTWSSLILIAVVASGCGGGGAPLKEEVQESQPLAPVDTLAKQVFSIVQDTVMSPFLADRSEEDVEPMADTAPAARPDDRAPMVYRIQVLTTKDLARATAVREEAAADFGAEVRVDFETPYYKVRVGTFETPQEAEPLLVEARRLGYRGAWAVRVRVSGEED